VSENDLDKLMRALFGIVMTCLTVFLCGTVLSLVIGCASTPAELAARDAELHRRLEPCQYVAVEVDSGQVICEPNDCACHAELIRKTLGRGHVESNFPANQ
jgi:hypothetical protein